MRIPVRMRSLLLNPPMPQIHRSYGSIPFSHSLILTATTRDTGNCRAPPESDRRVLQARSPEWRHPLVAPGQPRRLHPSRLSPQRRERAAAVHRDSAGAGAPRRFHDGSGIRWFGELNPLSGAHRRRSTVLGRPHMVYRASTAEAASTPSLPVLVRDSTLYTQLAPHSH